MKLLINAILGMAVASVLSIIFHAFTRMRKEKKEWLESEKKYHEWLDSLSPRDRRAFDYYGEHIGEDITLGTEWEDWWRGMTEEEKDRRFLDPNMTDEERAPFKRDTRFDIKK